jgi:D-sedoheptulose 7-phosphate isomerase
MQSAGVKRDTASQGVGASVAAAELMATAFQTGGKLLLCGNGGSAAACQHMAAEFVGRFSKGVVRNGLPALALTTDTSFLTAYADDVAFEEDFSRQVQALGRSGDVLIVISTSGNSPNVLAAVQAGAQGMRIIALAGAGGRPAALADVAIAVPSLDIQRLQEAHLAVEHSICDLVELQLIHNQRPVQESAGGRS